MTTEERPVFTAHNLGDLTSTIPTLFGFTPEHSIVAIATYGERRRFGFRLRVDICSPGDAAELGGLITMHLRNNSADGFIVMGIGSRHEEATARLVSEAVIDNAGIMQHVLSAWVNTDDGTVIDMADPEDRTYTYDWTASAAMVQAAAAGQQMVSSRGEVVASFASAKGTPLYDEVAVSLANLEDPESVIDESTVSWAWEALVDSCTNNTEVLPGMIAVLARGLSNLPLRDMIWGEINQSTATVSACALQTAATNLPDEWAAPVFALCSFAHWQHGDGAKALIAAERAKALDPEYTLAGLMMQLLEGGVNPKIWKRMPKAEAS